MIECDYIPCPKQVGIINGHCTDDKIMGSLDVKGLPSRICTYQADRYGNRHYQILVGKDVNFKLAKCEISRLSELLTRIMEVDNV